MDCCFLLSDALNFLYDSGVKPSGTYPYTVITFVEDDEDDDDDNRGLLFDTASKEEDWNALLLVVAAAKAAKRIKYDFAIVFYKSQK